MARAICEKGEQQETKTRWSTVKLTSQGRENLAIIERTRVCRGGNLGSSMLVWTLKCRTGTWDPKGVQRPGSALMCNKREPLVLLEVRETAPSVRRDQLHKFLKKVAFIWIYGCLLDSGTGAFSLDLTVCP